MSKNIGKLLLILCLVILLVVPLGSVSAKGLHDGQVIFGQNYTLKSGETLNGDLVVFGGAVSIESDATVNGSVVLVGGSLSMDGTATKDVVVIGGAAHLGNSAHVRGNLVTMGAPLDRAQGAKVDGDTIDNVPSNYGFSGQPIVTPPTAPAPRFNIELSPLWSLLSLFGRSLLLGLLALLVTLFMPVYTRRVGETIAVQPVVAGGIGLLTIIVAPLALLIMIVTVILIPVALLAVVLLGVMIVFGWIGLGTEIGIRVGEMSPGSNIPLPALAFLGTFALTLVADGVGFVPCVGWLVPALLGLVGIGAVLMSRFGARPAVLAATPATGDSASPTPPQQNPE